MENSNLQEEIKNCDIRKRIRGTALKCGGGLGEKCNNCDKLDTAVNLNETLSDKNNESVRQSMKTEVEHFTVAPNIQHFAVEKVSKNDNVYGVKWGSLVREYLTKVYSAGNTQSEVVLWDKTYKVLKREKVTVFYDADGNTLFDVENGRLEMEYGYLMKEAGQPDGTKAEDDDNEVDKKKNDNTAEETSDKAVGEKTDEEQEESTEEQGKVFLGVDAAVEKLKSELEKAKDKNFAKPVIEYLIGRCKDSESLAQDICQPHKTWEKCFGYIYEQARKSIKGSSGAVKDNVVYEWAEDYFHRDDKAEEEQKAKEKREREKKQKEDQKKRIEAMEKKKAAKNNTTATSSTKTSEKESEIKPKQEASKPKSKKNEMDGQMSLFSMMGM